MAAANPQDMAAMANMPAMPPPPGVTPDLTNPYSREHQYIIVASIAIALLAVFVSLRTYAKVWIMRSPGIDDAVLFIAMIVMPLGLGTHLYNIRAARVPDIIHFSKVASTLLEQVILFTKLTLFMLLYRIFSPNKVAKYMILAGISFCVVFYTLMMFLFIFLKSNTKLLHVNYTVGAVNVISDLYILAIPIYAVSMLQLATRKKVGIMAIFLTGILACIMSILGLYYRVSYGEEMDISWYLIPVFIVTTVELDVGIMCGCMPFFPALVKNTNLASHARSLGSRIVHPHRSTQGGSRSAGLHHTGDEYTPPRSKEHYLELGQAPKGGIMCHKKLSMQSSEASDSPDRSGGVSVAVNAGPGVGKNTHTWETVDPETYMKRYGRG
ncbi:MAG: hypothetical protein LQ342_006783 [Letrouitia transgressa]|nr:MAG: hypothetical protein LQ342_006783 [Letrouitia transgressa]